MDKPDFNDAYKNKSFLCIREFINCYDSDNESSISPQLIESIISVSSLVNPNSLEKAIRNELWNISDAWSTPSKWKFWHRSYASNLAMWLNLCSGNGFKREEAIRSLSTEAPSTFFFMLIVHRLNDWVPQVRQAAQMQLVKIAQKTNPEYIVEALCSVFTRWNSWGRIEDHSRDLLIQLSLIDKVALTLKSKIKSELCGPMVTLMSQVARRGALDHSLIEIAHEGKQPAVRARAYKYLLDGKVV